MMNKNILFILPILLFSSCYGEEPWGKDCEINSVCNVKKSSPLQKLAECLIHFHQEVISPADGPRSHFKPSSSQYMLDAIHKYGFFGGIPLGCDRLMRENNDPWVYPTILLPTGEEFKWDPVP